jgi:hypothetical protein
VTITIALTQKDMDSSKASTIQQSLSSQSTVDSLLVSSGLTNSNYQATIATPPTSVTLTTVQPDGGPLGSTTVKVVIGGWPAWAAAGGRRRLQLPVQRCGQLTCAHPLSARLLLPLPAGVLAGVAGVGLIAAVFMLASKSRRGAADSDEEEDDEDYGARPRCRRRRRRRVDDAGAGPAALALVQLRWRRLPCAPCQRACLRRLSPGAAC